MTSIPLDFDTIQGLLKEQALKEMPHHGLPQLGPLRWHDETRRCCSRRCGTATNFTVQGSPKCMIHALEELNAMLINQGFKGVVTRAESRPTPVPLGRIIAASAKAYLEMGYALDRYECIHGVNLTKECNNCLIP